MSRTMTGMLAAAASIAVLTLVMLPLRSHLSIATTALILVVPVVIGVVTGGFAPGALSVAAGFLVYDFFFIPPYRTLAVGQAQNWAALGVYAAVMLPVAHVVGRMNDARAQARRQEREVRELFSLSDLLVEEKPLDELLSVIVTTLSDVFGCPQVTLFLPRDGRLEPGASVGPPFDAEQLRHVLPPPGEPASQVVSAPGTSDLLVLALAAAGRPVGLLVLSGDVIARHGREPLLLFANHVALAVERAQLREQALRARVTEEMARLARTLVTAVAHDLRTPLASIKASSSTLADADLDLGAEAGRKLAALIDTQADRLAGLVQNLLDMSRIQAGVLQPRRAATPLDSLVAGVVADLAPGLPPHEICVRMPAGLPPADIDQVLISRVLANLLENAIRHAPSAPVTVDAALADPDAIQVSVTDQGPGVSPQRRQEIFELFSRRPGDAGAGLGLTIARTFVEAHGQRIWVQDAPGGGAQFCFTLPVAVRTVKEPAVAAGTGH